MSSLHCIIFTNLCTPPAGGMYSPLRNPEGQSIELLNKLKSLDLHASAPFFRFHYLSERNMKGR